MIGALLVVAQLAIVAHAPDTASTCDAIGAATFCETTSELAPG